MSEVTPWLELDNQAHVRKLIKLINDNGFDIVVIDALGLVLGAVDENSPDMGRVMAKLKEIRSATGATLIVVHHPSKAGARMQEASGYNASGHAKLANFFEWAIELRAGEEPDTIVADIVKNRGWAKTRKFAASFSYKHFGPEHPELAHELESFKFYPEPIMDAGAKKAEAVREAVVAILQDAGKMNQKDLVAEVKAEVDKAIGTPVGEVAIRAAIKAMTEDETIKASQSAPRQPVFYSLFDTVDSVDSVDSR
jgi:RecA-family ATPase